MLVDANILLYAADELSPFHPKARSWLEAALNGSRRVGIPWQSFGSFLRIVTNPRALADPSQPADAWRIVESWIAAPATWISTPSVGYREILGQMLVGLDLRAGLVADAMLAALCIEHGLTIVSADSDFARFSEVAWFNPVA